MLSQFATVAASTVAVLAALLVGGSTAALADDPPSVPADAHFVPEATTAKWNGAVVTVTFKEVDVALESEATTISTRATVDVDAVCTQGESTLNVHRSVTALQTRDYPIDEDGVVAGTARVPLEIRGIVVKGFTCVLTRVSIVAALEDFFTGATLVHKS